MSTDSDRLLTPDEAAALLRLHGRTVRRWAERGIIPGAIRLPARWRFKEKELLRWIDELEVDPAPPKPQRTRAPAPRTGTRHQLYRP